MMELSAKEAATAVNLSRETIRLHIAAGRLPARKQGIRGDLRIESEDLLTYARTFGYKVDEQYLARLAKPTEN